MLVTFTSKAAADVMMFMDHAKLVLDLLHKNPERGVLTADETPRAIQIIEREIAESLAHSTSHEVTRDVKAHHTGEHDDSEHEEAEEVSFATRVYPLLEMMRAARTGGHDILWGV